ncbi:hypothetical protein MNEG_8183 [Monoraphidium neglectum]|jgi:hypothetical protein|uniref:Uncharacterized protein n=1 Tax=Monoraphidium neglectum TaxID=145388 RepID=A0A0D2MGC4_9CHLO|nr:hypothetical protein MNEG_8183 [Monoraphidium neglectum]KIY99781.1 hypothetical protein MNEG_8183 [Monoraphidium neglectum]|eukprot:XP_013898801.1 hypothetical protein MNEG_8183 [Monoraphidium neglectum]
MSQHNEEPNNGRDGRLADDYPPSAEGAPLGPDPVVAGAAGAGGAAHGLAATPTAPAPRGVAAGHDRASQGARVTVTAEVREQQRERVGEGSEACGPDGLLLGEGVGTAQHPSGRGSGAAGTGGFYSLPCSSHVLAATPASGAATPAAARAEGAPAGGAAPPLAARARRAAAGVREGLAHQLTALMRARAGAGADAAAGAGVSEVAALPESEVKTIADAMPPESPRGAAPPRRCGGRGVAVEEGAAMSASVPAASDPVSMAEMEDTRGLGDAVAKRFGVMAGHPHSRL